MDDKPNPDSRPADELSDPLRQAVEAAREGELVSIGLTGERGGRLRQSVDHCICIPSEEIPRIQEAHILTGHILCELCVTVAVAGSAEKKCVRRILDGVFNRRSPAVKEFGSPLLPYCWICLIGCS